MIGAWWQERPVRERAALVIGAVAVGATALYLIVEPMIKERQRLASEIPELRQNLAWMKGKLETVKRLQPRDEEGTVAPEDGLTPAVVQAAVRRAGLQKQMSGLRTNGSGVKVSLNEAAFAEVTEMLQDLRRRSRARVTEARIERLPEGEGKVDAELTLVAGNGS
ncbi:MAG: type II secretion system protein GspM [Thiohalorhabdaceae bacterium]